MSYDITQDKCAEHLSGAVQFATLSNDHEALMNFNAFFSMHEYLERTYPLVHQTLEKKVIGKAGLLFHWKGTGKSNAKPLMFMAHQDVVPEGDHEKWKYPPYSGTIAEGYVWGRGSSDCKSVMIAQLETIEHLISIGYEPDYDIYLAYGYNEEVSGGDAPSAARLIAEYLLSKNIRIGMALDEGGGMRSGEQDGVSVDLCAIGVAEKGYADFEIYRLDPGGHSARPHKNGALDYVAKAILAIADNQFPFRITEPVKLRFETLAKYMKPEKGELKDLLGDVEGNWEKLKSYIEEDPSMAAFFHTSMVATMAQGSAQANILPEKASIVVNCRLLAGDTLDGVKAHIESIIPEGMSVRLIKGNNPSPFSSVDTDEARLLADICREKFSMSTVLLPEVQAGATDAKYMYDVCDNVYRFTSFFRKASNRSVGAAHALNEAMNIEELTAGPDFYIELIKRYGKLS